MTEKVNKTYTSFHNHSIIKLTMSLGAEKGGSVVVYGFITQYVIYFMGKKPDPIQFYQHDW